MANPYQTAPHGALVTPSNSVDIDGDVVALYVGTGGTVQVVAENGDVLPHVNVPDGGIIQFAAKRVNLTGTTASDIVAYFL